jgi:predicted esterase
VISTVLLGIALLQADSITRADLAASYLRFEQAMELNPPEGSRLRAISQAFDSATLSFFTGRNAAAIEAIDSQTKSLSSTPVDEADLWRFKVRVKPSIVQSDKPFTVTTSILRMYGDASSRLIEVRLRHTTMAKEFSLGSIQTGIEGFASVSIDSVSLPEGEYEVNVSSGGYSITAGHVFACTELPSDAKARFEQEFEALPDEIDDVLVDAVKSRLDLLKDEPSEGNSAEFLANPNQLMESIKRQIELLKQGKNPFNEGKGDFWIRLRGSSPFPVRIYRPEVKATKLPVVIALHGMGGDENMFLEAYGAGLIRRLAIPKSYLLVSPRTEAFSASQENVRALLNFLEKAFVIDRERVYLVGHSMGAGAAITVASRNPELFAGVVAIAGVRSFSPDQSFPPVMFVAGEIDPIASPAQMRRVYDSAKAAGVDSEFKVYEGLGHTMVVAAALPSALDWLLARKSSGG